MRYTCRQTESLYRHAERQPGTGSDRKWPTELRDKPQLAARGLAPAKEPSQGEEKEEEMKKRKENDWKLSLLFVANVGGVVVKIVSEPSTALAFQGGRGPRLYLLC